MSSSFRIGFLINETGELPAWEAEMVDQLQIAGLIKDLIFISAPAKKIRQDSVAYRLFKKFENRWFRSLPDAFKSINVIERYPKASFFSSANNNLVEVDLIYKSCLVDNDPLTVLAPASGIWSVIFGNDKYKNADPPAFWEVMNDETVIGSSLQVSLPGKNKPFTVYQGETTTVPYSVKNTMNTLAWKSASFLAYRLKELLSLSSDAFFNKYQGLDENKSSTTNSNYKSPGNFRMFWLFTRNILRYLGYKLKKNKSRFTLLYSTETFSGDNLNLSSFKAMQMPEGVFRADPFIITNEGMHYIFFEEFSYQIGKAHICVMKIDNKGNCSSPAIVLDKPYHLSYPFILEWEDEYYMIPETSSNKTVELYKATEFPDRWEFVMNLMDNIVLIDATLIYENDTWWMFGTTSNNSFTSTNDQLLLYYSKDLFSKEWIPHPQNPVATDIANCRPSGKIFRINNQLYRPAQNNASRQYGYSLCINKIIALSETEYSEEKVSEIQPGEDNNLSAIHTFNFTNGLIVIDGIIK